MFEDSNTKEQQDAKEMYEKACQPNYERECHRLQEQCHMLALENERLKKALLNIALKLGE